MISDINAVDEGSGKPTELNIFWTIWQEVGEKGEIQLDGRGPGRKPGSGSIGMDKGLCDEDLQTIVELYGM